MTVNLQFMARISSLIDGESVIGGSVERPFNLQIAGLKYGQVFSLANAANTAIYNALPAAWDIGWVEADENIRLVVTDNNSASWSEWVRGTGITSRYGIPQIFPFQNTSSTFLINTITAFNTSGNTAKIKILLFD